MTTQRQIPRAPEMPERPGGDVAIDIPDGLELSSVVTYGTTDVHSNDEADSPAGSNGDNASEANDATDSRRIFSRVVTRGFGPLVVGAAIGVPELRGMAVEAAAYTLPDMDLPVSDNTEAMVEALDKIHWPGYALAAYATQSLVNAVTSRTSMRLGGSGGDRAAVSTMAKREQGELFRVLSGKPGALPKLANGWIISGIFSLMALSVASDAATQTEIRTNQVRALEASAEIGAVVLEIDVDDMAWVVSSTTQNTLDNSVVAGSLGSSQAVPFELDYGTIENRPVTLLGLPTIEDGNIVVDEATAKAINSGDTNLDLTVVESVPGSAMRRSTLSASVETVNEITGDESGQVYGYLATAEGAEAIARDLDVNVFTNDQWLDNTEKAWNENSVGLILSNITKMLAVSGAALAGFAAKGILTEQRQMIKLMRSVGATKRQVRSFVSEQMNQIAYRAFVPAVFGGYLVQEAVVDTSTFGFNSQITMGQTIGSLALGLGLIKATAGVTTAAMLHNDMTSEPGWTQKSLMKVNATVKRLVSQFRGAPQNA